MTAPRLLWAGLFCAWLPALAWAADDADALAALLEGIDSMEGQFSQTVRDRDGRAVETSTGSFQVADAARFRWQTREPWPELLVGDGAKVWFWEPDLDQVTVRPVDERLMASPALLFTGDPAAIRARWQVEQLADGGSARFGLTPRDAADAPFAALELTFRGAVPARIEARDAFGQRTAIELEAVAINADYPDEVFRFTVPEGADVIDGR